MAYPTAVNNQITDAVTQSNVKVIGEAPAMALGTLFQTMAHSTGVLFENATTIQQQQNTLAQAATNMGTMQIYSMDTMAGAGATEKVSQAGVSDQMTTMLALSEALKPKKPAGL